MKKCSIYYMIIVLSVLSGCTKELSDSIQEKYHYTVKAEIESSMARTLINGNLVEWSEGDEIGIYGDKGSVNVPFTRDYKDDFIGYLNEGECPVWAYYPYDSTAVSKGLELTLTLPSEWNYSYDTSVPMIGVKQNEGTFVFRHLCGLLKFNIDSISLDSTQLILKSEGYDAPAIAGRVTVDDITAPDAILTTNENVGEITINLNKQKGNTTFYIPLPVGKYPKLNVELFSKDSVLLFSNSISNAEIKRAVILNVGNVNNGEDITEDPIEEIKDFLQKNKNKDKDEFLKLLRDILIKCTGVLLVDPPVDSSLPEGLIEITKDDETIGIYNPPQYVGPDKQVEVSGKPHNHWISKIPSYSGTTLGYEGKSNYDDILENTNILCWVPFYSEIPHVSMDSHLVGTSPLNLKMKVFYNDNANYANLVNGLSSNGIISITSHGDKGKYIFVSDKSALGKEGFEIYQLYYEGNRYVGTKTIYPLMAEHFYGYNCYENAIVYNTSCYSFCNKLSIDHKLLDNQFSKMNISTYAGYSNLIYPDADKSFTKEYYYNLFHELKSNKGAVPEECSYALNNSSVGGRLDFEFWKEVKFVDFYPKGEVSFDEENITLPFEFKGLDNLKQNCKIGLLIGDNSLLDSLRSDRYRVFKYSVGELEKGNSLFTVKVPVPYYKEYLSDLDLPLENKMYYKVFLEYGNRRWISDEFGEFSFDLKEEEDDETVAAEAVDLGLSVKWASCNVGAAKPEEYGDYYAWGETEIKEEYTLRNYEFYNLMTGKIQDLGSNISNTKYDVAQKKWGGKWRMPTSDEFAELCDSCVWSDTIYNGVKGMKVTGKNGHSIFLPAAGAGVPGASILIPGEVGMYWSGTNANVENLANTPYVVHFEIGDTSYNSHVLLTTSSNGSYGLTIRPVME